MGGRERPGTSVHGEKKRGEGGNHLLSSSREDGSGCSSRKRPRPQSEWLPAHGCIRIKQTRGPTLTGVLLSLLMVTKVAPPHGWPLREAESRAAGLGLGEERQWLLVTRSHRRDGARHADMDHSLFILTYLRLLMA